ncbi:hypothetical protein GIB67_032198 [Kingdonia uniflora]|uniref:MADS-box domain-containing protein n=1 Tax=Kingdonia uniflora TaxID=39325 RepID=A0A7J7MX79_9MAGN|nr:hypothetical protein GIB67_032198 [Kingdonia uniflora]
MQSEAQKRKKKALELSILCNAEIALIMFSKWGKLDEYSTNGMYIMFFASPSAYLSLIVFCDFCC